MTTPNNITDLTIDSVSECLDAAKLLIDHRKEDGGMMGYAATLLLFSVTDAIGHHLNVGSGHTRLEVLRSKEFGISLTGQQVYELKQWFRNGLIRGASIVPGVFLAADEDGVPFSFECGKPVAIRVPQFYKMVRRVWNDLDKTNFNPLRHTCARPPVAFPLVVTQTDLAASGVTVPPVSGTFTTATTPSSGMFLMPPEENA